MQWTFPALFCDIGGTNVRFALLKDASSPLILLASCATSDFGSFTAALHTVVASDQTRPKSIFVCAAGPVDSVSVRLTNANWTIDGRQVASDLSFDQGLMFNDFEALALSIPAFQTSWLKSIGSGQASLHGARAIHGPGTGLGAAALVNVLGRWRAIASEGSHSDFAAVDGEELRYWPFIERRMGRITPETLISGPGLRRLHRARFAANGLEHPDIDESEISDRAIANPTGAEAETVKCFWRLVGRYAGDVALNFLATGGVYLAGGILPKIVDLLDEQDFRKAFENKAPYDTLAARIPVQLLMEPGAVLHGMSNIARRPELYAIDYEARAWRP